MAVESTARRQQAELAPLYRAAPHNIDAEQALLGAILVNNEAFYRVSDFLAPEHFYEPIHQKIFELASSLVRARYWFTVRPAMSMSVGRKVLSVTGVAILPARTRLDASSKIF